MNNDDDLRQLFDDATSEITPTGTLDDIRDRTTKVDPMARKWFLPSMAAAAAMALVIGGAFWATQDGDGDKGSSNVAVSPSGTPSVEVPQEVERDVSVYYVGDAATGPRLYSETARRTADSADSLALDAGNAALEGKPLDPDYRSAWTDTAIAGGGRDGDVLMITLTDSAPTERPAGMSEDLARLSVEQLVRSIQSGYGEALPVSFTATPSGEGEPFTPITSLLGVDTTAPYSPGSDDDVLALVSISDLTDGATVEPGRLTVKGLAATFEANVAWEILVGGDAVIDSGFTTATEGGVLSPYEFTTNIPLEGPGTYTVVVHDTDESGEGLPTNQDTKEIVVE